MLLAFNAIALFGALFSNTAGSETFFATGLSYVIWGIFYFLQFVRPNKIWRISWFLMMVVFLFFWQTGLGYLIGQMTFYNRSVIQEGLTLFLSNILKG